MRTTLLAFNGYAHAVFWYEQHAAVSEEADLFGVDPQVLGDSGGDIANRFNIGEAPHSI